MAGPAPTVNHPRASALERRIADLGANPARREAVALGLVDGVLEGETETLAAAVDALREARVRADGDQELSGWLDAAVAFAHWGLECAPSPAAVAQGTQAYDFLRALDGSPTVGSAELRRLLEVDETQVSRAGRRLLESGLVVRRKVGRQVFWQLTPRGRRALDDAPAPKRSPSPEFWQEALRRGYEGTAGEADPTRERIIERTLALHTSKGIRLTTVADIAGEAGVTVETVTELFPTRDDLVRSCGSHLLESLRLPPADRAPEVFSGTSDSARARRLVETLFGVYERGAEGISTGRRERSEVPVVDESMEALDATLDALVVEALRPLRVDSSSVASVRALTDLEVWRVLRDQGATPEGAVDQASGAVDRWLATSVRRSHG